MNSEVIHHVVHHSQQDWREKRPINSLNSCRSNLSFFSATTKEDPHFLSVLIL